MTGHRVFRDRQHGLAALSLLMLGGLAVTAAAARPTLQGLQSGLNDVEAEVSAMQDAPRPENAVQLRISAVAVTFGPPDLVDILLDNFAGAAPPHRHAGRRGPGGDRLRCDRRHRRAAGGHAGR